jgi:hypothetical protein
MKPYAINALDSDMFKFEILYNIEYKYVAQVFTLRQEGKLTLFYLIKLEWILV